ncbi:MAG: response regulator transcription factor [Bacteroidetes bacterium]|nr:response regulator transcription factor [Bacteroidota bacterium]
MIKVLIADDHSVVRSGIKQILSDESDMQVAGEACNSQEVIEMVSKEQYDVLVLDITMPGKSGLEVLTDVKKIRSDIPILILSMHPEEQFAVRALRSGASGYLTKESAPEELVVAIRKINGGGKYVSGSLAEVLAFDLEDRGKGRVIPHENLSDREFQVLCLIASGKSVKEMAKELFLSVKTISTYRTRILEKMKMKSNSELTYYAIQNKLIG